MWQTIVTLCWLQVTSNQKDQHSFVFIGTPWWLDCAHKGMCGMADPRWDVGKWALLGSVWDMAPPSTIRDEPSIHVPSLCFLPLCILLHEDTTWGPSWCQLPYLILLGIQEMSSYISIHYKSSSLWNLITAAQNELRQEHTKQNYPAKENSVQQTGLPPLIPRLHSFRYTTVFQYLQNQMKFSFTTGLANCCLIIRSW